MIVKRSTMVFMLVVALALPALAGVPGDSDPSIYKKKEKVPANHPLHKLFPKAEEIYEVEYTEEFLRSLADVSPVVKSGLAAADIKWVNPLCLTSLSPDKDRVSFLGDGAESQGLVEIRINSTLRWLFANVTLPASGAPAWSWAVVNTYMDEYVVWKKPDGTTTGFEMQNAFQLTGNSGCLNAGYWNQVIPNDTGLCGEYTFTWMYLHTQADDHPHTGPSVSDYRHDAWFKPVLTIIQ